MPLPSPSFTKTKWLSFFAELTAKITHHNPAVVLDGCDVTRRLLTTRISVGTLLEEGHFLQSLLDCLEGYVSVERSHSNSDMEMMDGMFRLLWLVLDLMGSLVADGDAYYTLLCVSRSLPILQMLYRVVQKSARHTSHFGRSFLAILAILQMPIEIPPPSADDMGAGDSIALQRHVQALVDQCAGYGATLQDLCRFLRAFGEAAISPAQIGCVNYLQRVASKKLVMIQRNLAAMSGENSLFGDLSGLSDREVSVHQDGPADGGISAEDVSAALQRLGACKSHHDFFLAMSDVWCCGVASPMLLASCLTVSTAQPLTRFLRAAPQNAMDRILFYGLISFFTFASFAGPLSGDVMLFLSLTPAQCILPMLSGNAPPPVDAGRGGSNRPKQQQQVEDALLGGGSDESQRGEADNRLRQNLGSLSSLISPLGSAPSGSASPYGRLPTSSVCSASREGGIASPSISRTVFADGNQSHMVSTPFSSSQSPSGAVPSPQNRATVVVGPAAQNPVVSAMLSFLIAMERLATPQVMSAWIRAGLLAVLESFVRQGEEIRSALVDTPTNTDGSLSDEVYLGCALTSAKVEASVLVCNACKLLTTVIADFEDLLLSSEMDGVEIARLMTDAFVPLLLKISIQNPMLASAEEFQQGSILHHVPRCTRAARCTSLGECATISLDACLLLVPTAVTEPTALRKFLSQIPALSRSTQRAVTPHVRAAVYRSLSRLCCGPQPLVVMVREMPSCIHSAVNIVLQYTPNAPQWEAAAAAEWLTHVILVSSNDQSIAEHFDLTQTALPLRLVYLVAGHPISYATASLLRLTTALFEQQQNLELRREKRLPEQGQGAPSPLVPYGRKSVSTWIQLLHTASTANVRLAKVFQNCTTMQTASRDMFSRCLAVFEDLASQFAYTTSVARALSYITIFDDSEGLGDGLIAELLESTLAVPSPAEIERLVERRFSVTLNASTRSSSSYLTLQRAYAAMIRAVTECGGVWFSSLGQPPKAPAGGGQPSSQSHRFEALPPQLVHVMVRFLGNDSIGTEVRCHVATTLNAMLVIPSQPLLVASLADDAGRLLAGTLSLGDSVPSVVALRCRLLAQYGLATEAARETGWMTGAADSFEKLAALLRRRGKESSTTFATVKEYELYLIVLSQVSSYFACHEAADLPEPVKRSISISLLTFLTTEQTAPTALRSIGSFMRSSEGRQVLLRDVTTTGDVAGRSCFGFALWNTLLAPTALGGAALIPIMLDHLAAAVALGGDSFSQLALRIRALEPIERHILDHDQKQSSPKLGFVKLLGALSFHAEVQLQWARNSELLTAVLSLADRHVRDSIGTSALLFLRNCCFHSSLKTQMCQDTRVLSLLRTALYGQGPLQDPRQTKPNELRYTLLSETPDHTVARRQELAASALRALTWNHERGKAYVRGILGTATSSLSSSFGDATAAGGPLRSIRDPNRAASSSSSPALVHHGRRSLDDDPSSFLADTSSLAGGGPRATGPMCQASVISGSSVIRASLAVNAEGEQVTLHKVPDFGGPGGSRGYSELMNESLEALVRAGLFGINK